MGVLTKKEKERLFSQIKEGETIEKEVAMSWDGKNLVVRFPKDIADYFGVNEQNRFTKNILFTVKEEGGKVSKGFDIVDRTKPKREIKKQNDKEKKTSEEKKIQNN